MCKYIFRSNMNSYSALGRIYEVAPSEKGTFFRDVLFRRGLESTYVTFEGKNNLTNLCLKMNVQVIIILLINLCMSMLFTHECY